MKIDLEKHMKIYCFTEITLYITMIQRLEILTLVEHRTGIHFFLPKIQ